MSTPLAVAKRSVDDTNDAQREEYAVVADAVSVK